MWVARHQFQSLKQEEETVRQFYSSIAEIAEDCEFSREFCQQCKQKSIDQMITMKLVFDTKSSEARKEMLKKKNLTLEMAIEELESEETIRKAQNELQPQLVKRVHRDGSQSQRRVRSRNRSAGRNKGQGQTQGQEKCFNCGKARHKEMQNCPARGKQCNKCGRLNHFSRVCMSKSTENSYEYQEQTKSNQGSNKYKYMGRRIVGGLMKVRQTRMVHVKLNGQEVRVVPDTGSDWDCISRRGLEKLEICDEDVQSPTTEMESTKTASGSEMTASGYVNIEVKFGEKRINRPFVVFDMVDDFILSHETLIEMDIVKINYKPSVKEIRKPQKLKSTKLPVPTKTEQCKKTGDCTKTSTSKEALVKEFQDVFAPREDPFGEEKFIIHLEENAVPCRVSHCRNIPYAYRNKLQEELEKFEAEGIITKVTKPTEWVNPIVVAPKKNTDDIRLCIDFRQLNRYCKREYFTSLTVLESVQLIKADEAKYFSKFDAKKGYHQCELDENSKDLTTFLTPFGRYRYERAPFGINSIPEHYNRRMYEALKDLKGIARVVDDIMVYGGTAEEHERNVRQLLQRCRERRIRLHEGKFEYRKEEIEFAGVIVSKNGFKANPDLINAISEFPEPTTATEMRSFHGTVNQLAPYDAELSKKFAPIRHLLKVKKGPIKLTNEEKESFNQVKQHLTSPATLAFYRPDQPVRVFTDAACKSGYGFVVQQRQPDGVWRPLICNSRVLTEAEKNYCPIEAEMTALAWALKRAEKFLKGPNSFVVYTDHKPLVSLVNKKRLDEVPNARLRAKLLKISDFKVIAEYIKGTENIAADAFSRHPVSQPQAEDIREGEDLAARVRKIQMQAIDLSNDLRLQEIKEHGNVDRVYEKLGEIISHGFPECK